MYNTKFKIFSNNFFFFFLPADVVDRNFFIAIKKILVSVTALLLIHLVLINVNNNSLINDATERERADPSSYKRKLNIISTFMHRVCMGTLFQRMYGHVHIIANFSAIKIQSRNKIKNVTVDDKELISLKFQIYSFITPVRKDIC